MSHTRSASKVAIVAGGSGDIGSAIAVALLEEGFIVASADIKPAPLALTATPSFQSDVVDLTDRAAVDGWVSKIARTAGPIDVLVVSLGGVRTSRLVDLADDAWHADLASLLDAPFIIATSVIRHMMHSPNPVPRRVIFVGSWAASTPHPHIGAYGVAKAGLRAMMRTLAVDHGPDHILINEIAPGLVNAGLSRIIFDQHPALAETTRSRIPTRRLILSEEVARCVVQLCDDRIVSQTGSVITMDGGISLTSAMDMSTGSGTEASNEGLLT